MDLQWIAPKGDGDLDGCRALRTTVFVGEQGIPEQVELDDRDADCTHVLIRLQGTVIATGRMLPEGRIGRMAVAAAYRGQGLGRIVLEGLQACAQSQGLSRVSLHAQHEAVGFYAAAGFGPCGDDFIEAGILHTPMDRVLPAGTGDALDVVFARLSAALPQPSAA